MVTQTPYPPPTNVNIESNDSHQITFAWDEVPVQCPFLQYIITAINCGLCPNITTDKNVTCDLQSNISPRTNNICLFAVQTEVCGHLRGEKSDYVVVHMSGEQYFISHTVLRITALICAIETGEGDSSTSMPQPGLWDSIETIVSVTCIHVTIHNITGPELVKFNNASSRAIVIPLVATVLSVGIFLLLLVVVVLIIFMSKQITNA